MSHGEARVRGRQAMATAGDVKDLAVSTVDASAGAIIAAGLATRQEIEAALADLTAFAARSDTLMGDPRLFQVWTTRS